MKRFLQSWSFLKHLILCLLITIIISKAGVALKPSTIQLNNDPVKDGEFTYTSAVIYFAGVPGYIILIIFLIILAFYKPVKELFRRIFNEI